MKLWLHFEADQLEDERSGVSCRRAARIEVDRFAGEILQPIDLRPHQDLHLGRRKPSNVVDLVIDRGISRRS